MRIFLFKRCCNGLTRRKQEGGVQEFHIFFHNLKGFHRVFCHELIVQVELESDSTVGHRNKDAAFQATLNFLTFKDSLSFLNMPLANFTKTFGLAELKKCWFPHKFSKLENLQYERKYSRPGVF